MKDHRELTKPCPLCGNQMVEVDAERELSPAERGGDAVLWWCGCGHREASDGRQLGLSPEGASTRWLRVNR